MGLYAIDGTWNSLLEGDEAVKNTNVHEFQRRYHTLPSFYRPGVGTRFGSFGKLLGGVFGMGGDGRVDYMYTNLCHTYLAGEKTIEIIGFSRGAALALELANRVFREGIRNPKTKQQEVKEPEIRFLGLWDTVASFGLTAGPFQKVNLGHELDLPANVTHCFHALALDERRSKFEPNRLRDQGAYEVWFRGVHSDIGGGNKNAGLNRISLRWMLRKAVALDLPISEADIPSDNEVNVNAALCEPLDPIPGGFRKVGPDDRVHYTVSARAGGRCNNPPPTCTIETPEDELTRVLA